MEIELFNKLCSWIYPLVNVDPATSSVCTVKTLIIPEVALHCLLRWLAGGSHLDIQISAGISVPSFHVCIYKCINALLLYNQPSIHFPISNEKILESTQKFKNEGTDDIVDRCVTCLDGMLLPIQTAFSDKTGNVTVYYSGHYTEYGIKIQAACDSFCCLYMFLFCHLVGHQMLLHSGGWAFVKGLRSCHLGCMSLPIRKACWQMFS